MAEYSKERASIFELFIRYRVASNNWNEVYSQTLLYFDRFCSENYPGVKGITQEMINGWCIQRPTEQKRSFIDRCQSALRLIEYLQNRNLISVVKPEMPPAPPKTHIPHAFSEEELCRFFSRCDENVKTARDQSSRFIALSVSVEFRLLYSSGMRPTETRLLRTENVDLARGIINVKETKGNQQHYVALHDDAIQLLRDYDAVASKRFPSRIIFFPMNSKNPDIPISPDMEWLSNERGCSPQSCNTRLSSFRKFIKYLSSRNPKYLYLLDEVSKVPLRKKTKKKVSGLSREAIKVILAEPDTTHKTGIRDLALMVILYATAARIDEILSIRIKELKLDIEKPYVVIIGKGDKVRTLYLLPKAVAHIRLYIKVFHGSNLKPDSFLFFSRNKGTMEKLSQSAVRKMMKKYASACHEKCADVPLDLHAHQFRHAKASHWLEDGMNIAQISFLLGHSQLETTMIYLDITMEQEAAALATLEDESDRNAVPKWNPDTDSLSSICGLRKLQ